MAAISFKSSGKTKEETLVNKLNNSPVPIGIQTPLRPGDGEIFAVNYSLSDQVHNNLKDLILTNWGERLALFDFGANLKELLSEFVSQDDFDSKAVERISGTVKKWMPFISLETFETKIDNHANANSSGTAVVKLMVFYSVPALQINNKSLEITLNVM